MIYILRDLNVMGLQILKAWVINCSRVYEKTGSHCDISLSNVSPGNKGCLSIWHEDPERLQLGMLHDWQLAPGDGFWCQKGEHLPNCCSLKSILLFIRQLLVNILSVCSLRFGNKHAILMINLATTNNTIKQPTKHHSNKFI